MTKAAVATGATDDLAGLNDRERAFVLQYFIHDRNGTKAAIAAGYSAKTAGQKASQLLKKVQVKTAIQNRLDAKFREMHMSADEVLARLANQGRFTLRGMVKTINGAPVVDIDSATPDQLDALTELTLTEDGKLKVKGPPVTAALTTLAKYHGLLKDRVEVEITESAADIMAAAHERARRARAEREGNE